MSPHLNLSRFSRGVEVEARDLSTFLLAALAITITMDNRATL